ncbi:membrane protein insertase YidC [Rummeliibacillus suwonensis]|uniref:membrane protein insertase YidC n=1 Tax=Rummeliibacillus suwonensis TaxID=1306154 RepID=UPI001AAE6DF5|nr:membrane protein insertase YidC [Rummeliibacillus suwonensis]MBO2535370.1 membrane protein insertase YidC [Rummeliibacillus suwonensis]
MKQIGFIIFSLFISIVLSGCTNTDSADSNIFFQLFVIPVEHIIHFLSENFHGSYGWAIIVITCGIRLLLMPFMLHQMKKQKEMQKQMVQVKPTYDSLQEKIKMTDDMDKKMEYQQELLKLYMNNMPITTRGCLPFLLQTPLLMGLYYAIRYDQTIASQPFLWFNLGTPDIVLTLIACLLYYLQSYFSLRTLKESQRKQMKYIGFISPIMIGFISLNSASALSLYWSTSAVLLIVQQLIAIKLYSKHEVEDKVQS